MSQSLSQQPQHTTPLTDYAESGKLAVKKRAAIFDLLFGQRPSDYKVPSPRSSRCSQGHRDLCAELLPCFYRPICTCQYGNRVCYDEVLPSHILPSSSHHLANPQVCHCKQAVEQGRLAAQTEQHQTEQEKRFAQYDMFLEDREDSALDETVGKQDDVELIEEIEEIEEIPQDAQTEYDEEVEEACSCDDSEEIPEDAQTEYDEEVEEACSCDDSECDSGEEECECGKDGCVCGEEIDGEWEDEYGCSSSCESEMEASVDADSDVADDEPKPLPPSQNWVVLDMGFPGHTHRVLFM